MQYIEIRANLKDFMVISANDISKVDQSFHKQRLSEWQKKGYIKKIAKGYYIFSDLEINESVLFIIANKIFDPSYVSLEMALSYYGLIPESVYSITSITSKKAYKLASPLGQFNYRKIKPESMFGYKLVNYQNHSFKIAEIEKAILDYFYVNSKLKTNGEFEELRINRDAFQEKVDIKKLREYLAQFSNKVLEKRVNLFLKYINA
jgi:predicted transcriptional regulator of viral defense system